MTSGRDGRTARPVWLLDIDGVVNVVGLDPQEAAWPPDVWQRAEGTVDGIRYPLLVAIPVVEFVREVHEARAAEVRWHTTWQHHAVHTFSPLFGLPELPVQEAPEFASPPAPRALDGTVVPASAWWKLGAAERVVAEEKRPLVWTDDDLGYVAETVGLGAIERADDCLLISPRTDRGLTPGHLDKIRSFLAM